MVNRIPRAGHAIDEALSLSATILRILGKLNSKAAKVRKTRAGKGHRGAGWPTKARAAVPVSGTPPAGPPDKRVRETTMKAIFRAAFRSLAFAAALIATSAAAADLYGRRPGPAYAAAPFS